MKTRADERYDLLRRSRFVAGCQCGCGWRGPSVRAVSVQDVCTGETTDRYIVDSGSHIVMHGEPSVSVALAELAKWVHREP